VEGLSTAELAREGNVNVETIRYYERRGLLPKPRRTPSGYRNFSGDYVQRLRFIRHAQELGFTLKEVKELLTIRIRAGSSCADVRRRAEAKVAAVDEKIQQLQAIRDALVKLVAKCSGQGPLASCSILEALSGQESC
jgi:Hg(II)-responsive transcriptional regulator